MALNTWAQTTVKGKIFDAITKEPLAGASIFVENSNEGTHSNSMGAFNFTTHFTIEKVQVAFAGYQSVTVTLTGKELSIALSPTSNRIQEVVVTASREVQLRREAPIAISKISSKQIEETKPTIINELINKVPGVIMTNLTNEQHMMAIRQPMTTSPYFLYMEDGIPIRPVGVFNHNALLEMNMYSLNSVEVIKGPSSSLYGSEANGGAVNFITLKPSAIPTVRIGIQRDNFGYVRTQFSGGSYVNQNLGFVASGFVAQQRNSWLTYSDYNKYGFNLRTDYRINDRSKLILAGSIDKYRTEMTGSVDSSGFYNRKYQSNNEFTFRNVNALRIRLTHEFEINKNSELVTSLYIRNNDIEQLPSYAIKKDLNNPTIAHGQHNDNAFKSIGFVSQNSTKLKFLNSKLITGLSYDYSPNTYWASYVSITRDTKTGFYPSAVEHPDSVLANYKANIANLGAYFQYEFSPVQRLKIVLGGRYDNIRYNFDNYLPSTAFTGAPDSKNSFDSFTPKVGLTYNFNPDLGAYANYSRGFCPPSVNQLYSGVKVPSLQPSKFDNYEIGGWATVLKKWLYVDFSFYQMNGFNEVVSYRLVDNSTESRNSGKTLHRGIEYSLNFTPNNQLSFRFGGSNVVHQYVNYEVSSTLNYNGKEMPQAPHFIANAEITYRPSFLKGFRVATEWQRISSYFLDNGNTQRYNDRTLFGLKGVSTMNFRAGYNLKGIEIFGNLMNVSNELYANNATLGAFGKSFTPASPRTLTIGLTYQFRGRQNQ